MSSTQNKDFSDMILIERIRKGDESAFEMLFNRYYKGLVLLAFKYLPDKDMCESIVQNVFVTLWESRLKLNIQAVSGYLVVSVRNRCQNENKRLQIIQKHQKNLVVEEFEDELVLPNEEVMNKIYQAIEAMPEQRKKIFKMNRLDGLKYKEIASQLGLSVKTVEVQIGKALKYLRENLQPYKQYLYQNN